jgi:hypothetical protein
MDYLLRDRQVRKSPGKILREITNLPDHEIRDVVAQYQLWVEKENPCVEVKFAITPDEVEQVYLNPAPDEMENARGDMVAEGEPLEDVVAEGSSAPSCMGHEEGHYDSFVHPARVYGDSPDDSIAVAYIEDSKGILARTVCSMGEKTHIRVYHRYGTKGGIILRAKLCKLGFTEASRLVGKVRAIWQDEDNGVLVMPYLDSNTAFDVNGDEIVFERYGKYTCSNTNGCVDTEEEETCDCCGSRVRETQYVAYDDRSLCDTCLEDEYTYAYNGRHQEYVPNGAAYYCESDGEYYTERGIDYHDLVWDRNRELRTRDDVTWIDTIDEYVENDEAFVDGAGESRWIQELNLSWWVTPEGELYEDDPEVEGSMEIGAWCAINLWGIKQDQWSHIAERQFDGYVVQSRILNVLRREVRRSYKLDLGAWMHMATKYDVIYDERDRPVYQGQTELALAA